MTCPTNKRGYPTENIAEEALIQARIQFEYNTAIAIYECGDCGQWHMTSKGEVNRKLKELLDTGEIKKERNAMHWGHKLR